jgi:hypothetical protein
MTPCVEEDSGSSMHPQSITVNTVAIKCVFMAYTCPAKSIVESGHPDRPLRDLS